MSNFQPISRKWTKNLLVALGVFTVTDLVASHFHRHSFQYTKFLYRMVNGTTFEVRGKTAHIPEQCYLQERSDNPVSQKPSFLFSCELGVVPFLGVTIFHGYSPEEIQVFSAPRPLLRDFKKMPNYFSFDVAADDYPGKVFSFYVFPELGVSMSPGDKRLAEPFVSALLAISNTTEDPK